MFRVQIDDDVEMEKLWWTFIEEMLTIPILEIPNAAKSRSTPWRRRPRRNFPVLLITCHLPQRVA